MKIHLPNSAFIGNIDSFFKGFDPSNDKELIITSNQKWISVHPLIISMVIALSEEVKRKGGKIICEDFNAKSKSYLLRMGLIDSVQQDHGITIDGHESAGRFIPARIIKTSNELNNFITDMVPLLHATPSQADPIKYVMSEMVRNVLEHSNSEIGAVVSAQYFKKSNRVSIGIADRGIGIKAAIGQSYPTASDKEAITMALMPGITGTTKKIGGTEFNAGAGLFFTKSIAKVSRDFFILYSGSSFFKLLKTNKGKGVRLFADARNDRSSFVEETQKWRGTAVGIDISLDLSDDFQNLLELIRDAYSLEVREAKKTKYKKPQFI